MKIFIKFFIFLILPLKVLCKTDLENFLQGNLLYDQNKYQDAFECYNKIKNKNHSTYFNMGNCLYKLNKFVPAIANWKKTEKETRFSDFLNIDYNIEQTYKRLNIENKESIFDQFYNFLIKYLSIFSLINLQLIFIGLWYFIIFMWKFLRTNLYFLIILLFSSGIILGCIGLKISYLNQKVGLINEKIEILAGPNANYHSIGTLNLADKVKLLELSNNWAKITNNIYTGWVVSDKLSLF